jgi:hypothetical protein
MLRVILATLVSLTFFGYSRWGRSPLHQRQRWTQMWSKRRSWSIEQGLSAPCSPVHCLQYWIGCPGRRYSVTYVRSRHKRWTLVWGPFICHVFCAIGMKAQLLQGKSNALKSLESAMLTGIVAKSSFPVLGTRTVPSQLGHGVVRKWPFTAPLGFVMWEGSAFCFGPIREVSSPEEVTLSIERSVRELGRSFCYWKLEGRDVTAESSTLWITEFEVSNMMA